MAFQEAHMEAYGSKKNKYLFHSAVLTVLCVQFIVHVIMCLFSGRWEIRRAVVGDQKTTDSESGPVDF